jgi:protocatechuate 3,4-dioxygenase, beta subunit
MKCERCSPMPSFPSDRRMFLGGLAASLYFTPGLFADMLKTPSLTEGPFYPDKMPLDTDNDLIKLGDSLTPAVGEITHLTGRVLDISGSPVKDAVVEIWQCDAKGVYLHTADSGKKQSQMDKNFQGFGRFAANSKGEYRFRTIKPVPYPGRPAPHIHVKVKQGDKTLLTTQFVIAGHEGNKRDGVFLNAKDLIDRELISVEFKPMKTETLTEYSANFDIVLGVTPEKK